MKREALLMSYLEEIEVGTSTLEETLVRNTQLRRDLMPLVQVSHQLRELPKNIVLSPASKTRLRAQLLMEAERTVPAQGLSALWASLRERMLDVLQPQYLGHLLVRPMGVALTLLVAFSLVGAGTVSAAMDTVPGDGLYPVKLTAEQTRLAFAFSDQDKADAYIWIASSRINELSKLGESGRDFHSVGKVASDYQHSVAQALLFSASQKHDEGKVQQRLTKVQTSLQEIYDKAPEDMQVMIAQTLTLASTGSSIINSGPAVAPSDRIVGQDPISEGSLGNITAPNLPAPSGLPAGSRLGDKGDVTTEPSPVKDGPLSNPSPPSTPSERLPNKGDVGPAPGPIANKEVPAPPASNLSPEPSKSDQAPVDTLAPKEGGTSSLDSNSKGSTGIQGASETPLRGSSPSKL